jgi:hypothetical protein
MTKKKGLKRFNLFNISNKLGYTLIVILTIVLLGIGVYANSVGTAPNPGHLLSTLSPDSPCSSGQVVSWNGANLVCTTPTTLPSCSTGQVAYMTSSGWSCKEALIYPVEVKETTGGYHDGNFGGYSGIQSWIQSNGCSGYHVCTSLELVYAFTYLPNAALCGDGTCFGWFNSGYEESDGMRFSNDCYGWTSNENRFEGSFVNGQKVIAAISCDIPFYYANVLCCR